MYYDFDEDNPDGVYIKWTVGGSQPITDYAKCFYSAGLGYLDYDHRRADDFDAGLSDLPLTAGISIDLGKGLTATISTTTASRWTPSTTTVLMTRTKPG